MSRLVYFSLIIVSLSSVLTAEYLITTNDGLGRVFDGIGAVSGGGATSKLLPSYPENQRNEILDLLFKPNFGASLQVLKVEIGGDDDTTDGAEASHMREPNEENYQRGYEWWLMKEAYKRNPNIKFQALAWSWPNWLGNKILSTPYGNLTNTAIYIAKWIKGAKEHHGITIDSVGIWNEKTTNFDYILELRRVLDMFNLTTCNIVAPDHLALTAPEFQTYIDNKAVFDTIHAFSMHYAGTYLAQNAINSGKRLWASEDYSTFNDDVGAGCFARLINRNYAYSYMTSTMAWNLITSYYSGLDYPRNGLMNAYEPWSGHYDINNPIWIAAHTTQFSAVGWQYLKHGNGVGKLSQGGTYVSLTNSKDLTIVIETMTRNHSICVRPYLEPYTVKAQVAVFRLDQSFSTIKYLNVWRSTLRFGSSQTSSVFEKDPQPIMITDTNLVTIHLDVDQIITLTSLDTGLKGLPTNIPVSNAFPLPYSENFEAYEQFEEPAYLAPQTGAWEVVQTNEVNHGKVARQVVTKEPVNWCFGERKIVSPFAIIGSENWQNVTVTVDIRAAATDYPHVLIIGSKVVKKPGCGSGISRGVFLRMFPSSKTVALSRDFGGLDLIGLHVMKENFALNRWYNVQLSIDGERAVVRVGSAETFGAKLPLLERGRTGYVAIAAMEFGKFDIDNLRIN